MQRNEMDYSHSHAWKRWETISQQLMTTVLNHVARQFGGGSLDGPGRGIWIGADGTMFDEPSYVLSVACQPLDLQKARETVVWIGKALQQEAMYFEIQDSPVEIIRIESEQQ